MPIVGLLVAKVDTRYLVALGFSIFAICSFVWGELTLQISPWTLAIPIIISGFALGMVFVPLSVTTLGDLKPEQVGNGSGLYNLLRNVGGSVGISAVETLLARHSQFHLDRLTNNLASTGEAWRNRIDLLTNAFTASSGSTLAHSQAIAEISRQLQRQADLMSYIDDFRYMALACLCCVPFVWMLKKVKRSGANAAAH
jgi:DHA2 family multidrug resistance protein